MSRFEYDDDDKLARWDEKACERILLIWATWLNHQTPNTENNGNTK